MNRRTSLSTLVGKTSKVKSKTKTAAKVGVSGLDTYTGPWNFEKAAHLLRRSTFGPNFHQILAVVDDGLESTINQLLAPLPLPSPPINYFSTDDPDVPLGETWLNVPASFDHRVHRKKSLEGWTVKQVLDEGISLREKMTLFWHNHFVTSGFAQSVRLKHKYITTIRENSLGNFRELTKKMTVDPLMLFYLNGATSTNVAPNENYARELLELFTIGKGPLIAPGDYTNYKESDIAEIARVLTGWTVLDNNPAFPAEPYIHVKFVENRHDDGEKQLSSHFDNQTISNAGENEYLNLINIIFEKDEVARFICRKIYRWFVHYTIDEEIESNIIQPLAQILIDNDYEVSEVLRTLFTSEHFYSEDFIGCMIKNPWDFAISLVKQLNVPFPNDPAIYYETFRVIFQGTLGLQMEYYLPPNVAGWTPYYQAPSYYRLWLNAVTLRLRNTATSTFSSLGVPLFENPSTPIGLATIDYLWHLDNLTDPFDVNIVIDDFIRLLLPKDLADNQKAILKEVLIPGLPDEEWNVEYAEYASDPTNTALAASIKNRVNILVGTIINMPEYQLM